MARDKTLPPFFCWCCLRCAPWSTGGILIYIGNNQSKEDEKDKSHKVTSLASTIFYAGGVIILYALSNLLQALEDVLDILEESEETEERV